MKSLCRFWVASVLVLLAASAVAQAPSYTIFDLSIGSGFDATLAYGINQNGIACGTGSMPVTGDLHACIFPNGPAQDLGELGFPYGADAVGINNNLQLSCDGYGPGTNAVFYHNGNVTRLGSNDGGYTYAGPINSLGDIVGRAQTGDGGFTGFSYIGGHFTVMTTALFCAGINDSDQIAGSMGYYWTYGGTGRSTYHAFIYSGGNYTDLGNLGGGLRTPTQAFAINNASQVAGSSTLADGSVHAFLYSGGVMHDIGTIGTYYAYPTSMNNVGQIIGNIQTYVGGPVGPFLYTNGAMHYLTDLLDSSGAGWSSLNVFGINDNGWIVGYGTFNGNAHGFIVAPARPLPVTGTVNLQNYSASAIAGTQVTVEIRSPGSTAPLESHVVSLDASGNFSFTTALPPGSYDVAAKPAHWLRKTLPNLTLGPFGLIGLSFSLVNGDVNGDNVVSLADFGELRAAFGSSSGSGNWNPNADLNGDGAVTLADFGILRSNFGRQGDP